MDSSFKFPASPATPLFPVSPERVNQQRSSVFDESPGRDRHSRESSVHDKVAAFNSLAFQGKQLERKTNDAALKRAMLGREEAESEMRRYRDEARSLRKQVDEGKERERRVGERLESVMVSFNIADDTSLLMALQENYGRAKETHAHTQTLWEKEIRRARKENFKSQSAVVKLQEELKSARLSLKTMQGDLEQEKERSLKREQEAFAARYQLVGVQEELAQMQEQMKLVEQERDALRTIAQNEEIARIAAEGRIPLPSAPQDDEFASPKKARKSLDLITVISSAASEEELDELRMKYQWERQRADRAHDRVEFLETECRLNCCACRGSRPAPASEDDQRMSNKKIKPSQPSTVFIPSEGVFRTISPAPEEAPWISSAQISTPVLEEPPRTEETRSFARTPSCEPPAPALIADVNQSLLSLFDAPPSPTRSEEEDDNEDTIRQSMPVKELTKKPALETTKIETFHTISTTTRIPLASAPDLTPVKPLPSTLDPSLKPTMSREEALAQIRERRGRARSIAQGTMTPRKQMVEGAGTRRDISAPAIRSGAVRGRSQARA
jgi:hypothetical protein